jgi:hypothetical protein
MDLDAKKSRVLPKQHASSLEETDDLLHQATGRKSDHSSIDKQLLDLVKSMNHTDSGLNFAESLASHIDKIGYDLRLAHHLLAQNDRQGLDHLAQQLTQNALKVGAVKILSGAFEIQGLARIGDFTGVSEALGSLEVEYQRVRSQLT